ncbi:MAG TPA: ABC transporter permease [Verrucomicrobiae bacterium]|nr:ABC transporter permease [Verrucomicrobiae bacterium]
MNRRKQILSELSADIREHIARETEDNIARGLSPQEARRRAFLKFGNVARIQEETRRIWTLVWLEQLAQDLRFAFRSLRKSPGFYAIAALTVALGIGANVAAFSMLNAIIIHPYNFQDLDQLVKVWEDRGVDAGFDARQIAPADLEDIRTGANVFSSLASYRYQNFSLNSQSGVESVLGCAVSANFFSVLAVSPMIGRSFVPEEQRPGAGTVAILSYALWQRQLGGQPALGKTIQLDGRSYTVIGVMPNGFDYPVPVELWVPLDLTPAQQADRAQFSLQAVGRLSSGATVGQASAALSAVAQRLARTYPATNLGRRANALQLRRELYLFTLPLFLLLQAAAAFVSFLAGANLVNLLFARMISRQREVALRVALGADRRRLARLFVTESLLFSLLGGVVAVAISFWTVSLLRTSISPSWTKWIPGWGGIQVSHSVLAFAIGLTALVGIFFGLATVLHSGRVDLNSTLKDTGAGTISLAKAKLRNSMVVAQVTFALVLLVCAGLTIQGFLRLSDMYKGFQAANLLRAEISLPRSSYPDRAKITNFYRQLLQSTSALPGVSSSALVSNTPASSVDNPTTEFTIEGRATQKLQTPSAALQISSPDYFNALRIPLIAGRFFSPSDTENSQRVVLISRSMAQRFWPVGDALGHRIKLGNADSSVRWLTIVGLVGDVRQNWWSPNESPTIYEPLEQAPTRTMYLVLRTASLPSSYVSAVRNAISHVDAGIPSNSINTLQNEVDDSIAIIRILGILIGAFGVVALALSSLGVYGVLSERVAQRTREIGVRVALGAMPRDVMRLILGQALTLMLIGILIGAPVAVAVALVMKSAIYGVVQLNYLILLGIALLLGAVSVIAGYIPARRAMKVDPMIALRHE